MLELTQVEGRFGQIYQILGLCFLQIRTDHITDIRDEALNGALALEFQGGDRDGDGGCLIDVEVCSLPEFVAIKDLDQVTGDHTHHTPGTRADVILLWFLLIRSGFL